MRDATEPSPAAHPAEVRHGEPRFCAVCQVSVPRAEIERGEARWSPRGRLFCGVCVRATPEQRLRRREALEAEFADDAPLAPVPVPSAAPERMTDFQVLELRVGELERSAFKLRERVRVLEERLGE